MRDRLAMAFSQATETGFDFRIIRRDGVSRWVSMTFQPITGADGAFLGVRGSLRDITDRKGAEEERARLAAVIEATSDFVGIADLDGRPLYLNKGGRQMLGIGEDEDISNIKLAEGHPEWARALVLNEGIPTALRDGIWRGETALLTRDGRGIPVLQVIVAPRRPDGTADFHATIMRDITERKRAELALRAHVRQQAAVAELGQRALAGQPLSALMDEAVALAAQGLEVEFAKVLELLPDGQRLRLRAGVGWREAYVGRATVDAGAASQAGYTLLSSEPVILEDADTERRFTLPPLLRDHGVVSGISVPIAGPDRLFGVLGAHTRQRRVFTQDDIHFLQGIAHVLAEAIRRQQAAAAIQRHLQRLSALRAIDVAISASLDVRLTLNVFLEQVVAQLGVDAADVLLLNPHTHTLEYAAGRGFRSQAIERSHVPLGQGYAGLAALERRTVGLANLAEEEPDLARAPLVQGEDFRAYYGAPLMAKGVVQGVLELFHRAPLTPDPEWLDFLEALAGQAAIAIDNANLFTQLQRSNLQLTLAYDATIEGWSRALDLRDKETEGHTRRVTEMTERLARAMGMSEDELVHVRRGALLHDIGKMGIPDSILLKPGPLTDDEWVIMRKHPTYAYEMLSPIVFLRPALNIPYCHHEKWDGTGYPRGLKGEQIPLAARIFAVADVWDALRSDRPYRAGWPEEKVREHIREQAGEHFDPQAAEAFLRTIEGSGERT